MMNTSDERVKEVLYKNGKVIVHIGRDVIDATRFFIFSKSTAQEVVDVLTKFIAAT